MAVKTRNVEEHEPLLFCLVDTKLTGATLAFVGLVLSDYVEDSLSKSCSAQPHMAGQSSEPVAIAQIKVCSTSCMDVPRYLQPKSRAEIDCVIPKS